ncbi:nucleotidyltransferase domain-containing protein [Candidatus Woesearchaeota archaeon]|nr:nucleotidyltransferase domain-containing protein [Candidatus Woesearchaeota archaeon]
MYNNLYNEEKVLKVLFEESNKEFHIRLLARLTGLHPNTIINITDKLSENNLITKNKNKDNGLVIVKANTKNPLYKLKKQFYNIRKIYESKVIEFLNDKLNYPIIILFGSYAKAENHKDSDIDLFVICTEKKELKLEKYESVLNAEIQLFLHTQEEFKKLQKKSPELINNVLNGYKLAGYLEVFSELQKFHKRGKSNRRRKRQAKGKSTG